MFLRKFVETRKCEKLIKSVNISKLNEFVKECYSPFNVKIPDDKIKLVKSKKLPISFASLIHGEPSSEIEAAFKTMFGKSYHGEYRDKARDNFIILYNAEKFVESKIYKYAKNHKVVNQIIEAILVEEISHHYYGFLRSYSIVDLLKSNNLDADIIKIIAKRALEETVARSHAIYYLEMLYGDYSKSVWMKAMRDLYEEMIGKKIEIGVPQENIVKFISTLNLEPRKKWMYFSYVVHLYEDIANFISYNYLLSGQVDANSILNHYNENLQRTIEEIKKNIKKF